MYRLSSITPLADLANKDLTGLNTALSQARLSSFTSSLRLGACIQSKGQSFLRD